MKPPRRKKTAVPRGYLPFPITFPKKDVGQGCRPRFVCQGVLQEDGQVIVSAPGDMALLYHMGFYGQGNLSKHEPIFHNVVEQEIELIEKHLQDVSMERYSCSIHASVRSAAIHSEQVTPQRFVDLQSVDAEDLQYLKVSIKDSAHETSEALGQRPDPCDSGAVVEDSSGYSLAVENDIAPTTSPETDACLERAGFITETISAGECMDTDDSRPFTEDAVAWPQTAFLYTDYRAPVVSNQTLPVCSDVDEWKADDDFWESDRLPETVIHSPAATAQLPAVDKSWTVPVPDVPSADSTWSYLGHSKQDHTEESLSESSDDDHIPLSHLGLDDDHTDTSEDKSEYYKMREHLILDPCEAIFLKLAFDCIHITTPESEEAVSLGEMWKRCVDQDKSFLPKYAVYHHIRAKGWVPKDGLTYGCDFMVYKRGPKYYHSSLGVIVRCCDADNLVEIDDYNPRSLTWSKLMGLSRVINNVRKEMMICYVLMPSDITDEEMSSPELCLRKLSICETLLSRKVPSRERDKHGTEHSRPKPTDIKSKPKS